MSRCEGRILIYRDLTTDLPTGRYSVECDGDCPENAHCQKITTVSGEVGNRTWRIYCACAPSGAKFAPEPDTCHAVLVIKEHAGKAELIPTCEGACDPRANACVPFVFRYNKLVDYPDGSSTVVNVEEYGCDCRAVYALSLKEVTFAGVGFFDVRRDETGSVYAAPHWTDGSSGTARTFPVGYVQGTQMSVTATFAVQPALSAGDIVNIRATDVAGRYNLPATRATVDPTLMRILVTIACPTALAGNVDFLNSLTLKWEAQVNTGPWLNAGVSADRVYVTMDRPRKFGQGPWESDYESVLEISCRNAKGLAVEATIVNSIWSDFKSNVAAGVKRKTMDGYGRPDGVNMKYWFNRLRVRPPQLMIEMIKDPNGNGSCIAWSELFLGTIRAQGFTQGAIYEINSTAVAPFTADRSFLIKNWTFTGAGASGNANYPYTEGVDAKSGSLVPAQGNASSPPTFLNHFIVEYPINPTVFDPSYGNGSYPTEAAHEHASIDGFDGYVRNAAGAVIGLLCRKEPPPPTNGLRYTRLWS